MARPSRATERAGLHFTLHAQMGRGRSLEKLASLLDSAGLPVPIGTLKRYSREHGWQQRLLEVDAEAAARSRERAVEAIAAQAERHAQLGRLFQGLAARAADARLRDADSLARVPLSAIARAGLAGAEMERRAVGEQHDRRAVAIGIWNVLTKELLEAFIDLNASSMRAHGPNASSRPSTASSRHTFA